jgi:hypothetical protein
MHRYLIPIFVVSLSSCQTTIQQERSFAGTPKTMTVPQGGSELPGALKRGLKAAGWQLYVRPGPRVTQGTADGFESAATSRGRYGLSVDGSLLDDAMTLYKYDISVVDEKSGEEVLTMHGTDGERAIVRKFITALSK